MQQRKKLRSKKKRGKNAETGPNGSFEGKIIIGVRLPWAKRGRLPRPLPGAEVTIRQVVNGLSMAVHNGLIGGSNHLFPVNTGGYSMMFASSLADLPQASSWAAVFDQYRFEEVEIHFLPLMISPGVTNTATNLCDASTFVIDYDDSTALGSENAALEYDNAQTVMIYDEAVIRYKPAVAPAYFTSGAFSGYGVAPSDKEWLDSASASILHYGAKGWVGSLAPTSTLVAGWVVYAQYTVSFRNVR